MKSKDPLDYVASLAADLAASLDATVSASGPSIVEAAGLMISALRADGRILACGNGGSAADSQHLAAELVGRFLKERKPYAAIALSTDTSIITSLSNDYGFETVFERQVAAVGSRGDVLVAISTSGNSPNVLRAIEAAKKKGMKTIGLTGAGGGKMAGSADVLIEACSDSTPRIQEIHSFIIHILCGLVENGMTVKK